AKPVIAAVSPLVVVEHDQKTTVLIHIFESQLLQRIYTGRVAVLLGCVHGRPPGVAGADVQYEFGAEKMRPAATVVASLSIAACRSNLADRSQHSDTLFGVTEECAIRVAETMVQAKLIAV